MNEVTDTEQAAAQSTVERELEQTGEKSIFTRLGIDGLTPPHIGPSGSVAVAIILLGAVLSILSPQFLNIENLLDVGRQASLLSLMAIGVTVALISGQIDLSIAATYTLASLVCAFLLLDGVALPLAVLAGLGVGFLAGLINGLVATLLKLPSFIVTLGMLQIMNGISLVITDAQSQSLVSVEAAGMDIFRYAGQGEPAGIPIQILIVIAVTLLIAWMLKRTAFGLRVFAVGGNPRAADLAGLSVARTRIGAFIVSGLLAASAGLIGMAFIGSVSPIGAVGMELTVFAATVIGGASLFGGRGTAIGAVLGALLIGVLQNGLVLNQVSTFWQTIVIGIVTIVAVAINRILVVGDEGGEHV